MLWGCHTMKERSKELTSNSKRSSSVWFWREKIIATVMWSWYKEEAKHSYQIRRQPVRFDQEKKRSSVLSCYHIKNKRKAFIHNSRRNISIISLKENAKEDIVWLHHQEEAQINHDKRWSSMLWSHRIATKQKQNIDV